MLLGVQHLPFTLHARLYVINCIYMHACMLPGIKHLMIETDNIQPFALAAPFTCTPLLPLHVYSQELHAC